MSMEAPLPFSQSRFSQVTSLRRLQKLPRGAVPKVAIGQMVKAMEIIAVAEMPEERRLIDVAQLLRVAPQEADGYLTKRLGDLVSTGETLASRPLLMGLRKRRAVSPVDGRIAWAGDGQLLLEGGRKRIEILAACPGRITAIEPGEYIIMEANGAVLDLAWGMGGLAWGTLKMMDTAPVYHTETGRFNIDHRGAVIAIASPLTEQLLKEAVDIRVRGLVAASMEASLLPAVQHAAIPVGLTQGFGQIPMAERIVSLLNTHNGREISLDVMGMGDSRQSRPQIIIPIAQGQKPEDRAADRAGQAGLQRGQRVRILQNPYLGEIGTITDIPETPQPLASGLWLPGAYVEVAPGQTILVPFANLEQLG